jgi:hypothetical protein
MSPLRRLERNDPDRATSVDDRNAEPHAARQEFPQAWWTVLHATHGTPAGFRLSQPTRRDSRAASDAQRCGVSARSDSC